MEKDRATALPLSPIPPQLWDTLGSKLNQSKREQLPSKQQDAICRRLPLRSGSS